jgi:hypothetical protein
MSLRPVYVVDIMKLMAERVATALETPVHYQYGRVPEVINSLSEMERSPAEMIKMYPLIYLVMPFDEDNDSMEQDFTATLHVIIISDTQQQWKASERMEYVFKPTLYPIYLELLHQIASSAYFMDHSERQIPHTKTDWPHYGEKGNFTNDFIDAIDITNLRLRFNFNNCQNI